MIPSNPRKSTRLPWLAAKVKFWMLFPQALWDMDIHKKTSRKQCSNRTPSCPFCELIKHHLSLPTLLLIQSCFLLTRLWDGIYHLEKLVEWEDTLNPHLGCVELLRPHFGMCIPKNGRANRICTCFLQTPSKALVIC